MRASEARTGLSARPACHRSWLAYGKFSPLTPEVGAVCGKAARTDLCGGREVTRVPTAKPAISGNGTKRTKRTGLAMSVHRVRPEVIRQRVETALLTQLGHGARSSSKAGCVPFLSRCPVAKC